MATTWGDLTTWGILDTRWVPAPPISAGTITAATSSGPSITGAAGAAATISPA